MALTFSAGGGSHDFKRAPAGSHIAICNLVAECGYQPGSQNFPTPKRKLYVRFEIPGERVEYSTPDGKQMEGPLTIGAWYTASMNAKATLRKHLEGWRGKAFTDQEAEVFDVASILGKPCMLTVIEVERGGKTYSNITNIGKMPKGIEVGKTENPLIYYDTTLGEKELSALPDWLREKVEAQIIQSGRSPTESEARSDYEPFPDDDIPF